MDIIKYNRFWHNLLLLQLKLYNFFTVVHNFGGSRSCPACGTKLTDNENVICNNCNVMMPRTYYYKHKDNPMERPDFYELENINETNIKRLYPQNRIDRATAFFFYFENANYKHLITNLKYGGKKYLAAKLGKMAAQEFIEAQDFQHFDYIIPIPLHYKRKIIRGYNQSEWIAMGISQVVGAPVLFNVVKRTHNNKRQVLKDAIQRQIIDDTLFAVNAPKVLEGKKILLVDDVFTTGTTINTLAKKIKQCCNAEIYAFTLGVA